MLIQMPRPHPAQRSNESKAAKVPQNIGGEDNIVSVDACITRLRLVVKDEKAVKDSELKKLGASGVMRLGQGAVQIVFGPQAESIKDDIKEIMKNKETTKRSRLIKVCFFLFSHFRHMQQFIDPRSSVQAFALSPISEVDVNFKLKRRFIIDFLFLFH